MSRKLISLVFLGVGVVALFMLAWTLGFDTILEALKRFAPAFPIILAIEGASNLLSVVGWYYSFDPERRPGLFRLQIINFASLPLSGALPTGQAGEVLKGNLLRGHAQGGDIVSSLILYNYLHVVTTSMVMAGGPILALIVGGFSLEVSLILLAVCLGIVIFMLALGVLLVWGMFNRVAALMARLPVKILRSEGLLDKALGLDQRLGAMWRQRRGDLWKASFFLIIARLVQIAEVYVILRYLDLGMNVTITVSAMAFSGTALANYLLMVLPAREGFLEGSAYLVFELLGLKGAHGFTLELVRRIRKIAYQIFGLLLLLVLGLLDQRKRASEDKTPA